ncbi:MAG: ABC transporter ATP-binding protein [Rubrivivax sp.]
MLAFDNVTKRYPVSGGQHTVLDGVSFELMPGSHFGVLGRNGAGKSTLIRLLSGAELPSSGTVRRGMSVSWPLAFTGAFQGSLTGLDNLHFVARIYGVRPEAIRDYVEDFAELGRYFHEPVKTYSSGMLARLAFGLSMAIEFDCFLIDEVIAVGDSRFQRKCREELFGRRGDRAFVLVSHDPSMVREHCRQAGVLEAGRLRCFDDVEAALQAYESPATASSPEPSEAPT